MQPGCDPLDTACLNALLDAQRARLCALAPEQCVPGYVDPGYASRVALSATLPKPVNPYSEVLWVAKDAAGVTHHYGPNDVELFVSYPDGTVKASGAPISPELQQQLQASNQLATAPKQTAPSTPGAPIDSGSNYVPAFGDDISEGGFSFPLWGIAAAGVGLLFLMRSR